MTSSGCRHFICGFIFWECRFSCSTIMARRSCAPSGDTKRPLLFLMIAGVINACLNMVLVIVFKLGVAGVAIATVISQMISCVLGAAVPLPVGEQLPAAFFRAWHERVLLEADLFGRRSGRNPEHGH